MPRLLIVDDDSDLLELVCLIAGTHGYAVDCIEDGSKLFAALSADRVDAIIMDIYLGKQDGRELCLQVKSNASFKHIPVLLYSAGYIAAESIIAAKADGFLAKPFDITVLLQRIQQLLSKPAVDPGL